LKTNCSQRYPGKLHLTASTRLAAGTTQEEAFLFTLGRMNHERTAVDKIAQAVAKAFARFGR
jgi:hypothetical protein